MLFMWKESLGSTGPWEAGGRWAGKAIKRMWWSGSLLLASGACLRKTPGAHLADSCLSSLEGCPGGH